MRLKFKKNYVEYVKEIIEDRELTYFIDTMGCQMNENDSAKYKGILENMGFKPSNDEKTANLILFNTCCIRENAENTLFGRLGQLKSRKLKEKDVYIVVVGCMTQQKNIIEKVNKSYKFVDIVLGTSGIQLFPQKLYDMLASNVKSLDLSDINSDVIEGVPIIYSDKNKASISIIYGCNNFCTYCIVPYVRGRERSREFEDILNDVRKLAKEGYKEITLLGQNVNSYGKDLDQKRSFSELLKEMEKIEGIEIIKFMSPNPKDFTDELIDVIAESSKISKQIHLPLQSGSTRILKLMNRKYSKTDYLKLVEKINLKIKDVSFSTDIIVGFPGETNEDFLDTLDVVNKVKYDQIYMFIYSKRNGTIAAKMPDGTDKLEKVNRLEKLKQTHEIILNENNNSLIGQVFSLLVDGKSKNNEYYYSGRTNTNKTVIFKADDSMIGKIVNVKIQSNHLWYLKGEII